MLADVTRVARTRTVDAESFVEKQLAAERDFLRRHGIVCRNRHRLVTGESGRQRLSRRSRSSTHWNGIFSAANDECNSGKQQAEAKFSVHSVCCKPNEQHQKAAETGGPVCTCTGSVCVQQRQRAYNSHNVCFATAATDVTR